MQRSWATPFVEAFDHAFHEIKEVYQRDPFYFLSKWDLVAEVYSYMKKFPEVQEAETARFTMGKDGRWRHKKFKVENIRTTPLHLMLGFDDSEKPRSDICYIDMDTAQFAVTARYSRKSPTSLAGWRFKSGAGITVFYNSEIQYAKRKNTQTGRYSKTEGLKEMEKEMLREISNLKTWDKSILFFVDNHGLYTKNELESSFSKRLRPYTMKLYYLTPKSGFYITGSRKERY
jgi:hypothetical protein